MTSVFEIDDIDVDGFEVLLLDEHKNTVIVDLRDDYLIQAKRWKKGSKIRATIAPARSRFTPSMVLVFEGDIEFL